MSRASGRAHIRLNYQHVSGTDHTLLIADNFWHQIIFSDYHQSSSRLHHDSQPPNYVLFCHSAPTRSILAPISHFCRPSIISTHPSVISTAGRNLIAPQTEICRVREKFTTNELENTDKFCHLNPPYKDSSHTMAPPNPTLKAVSGLSQSFTMVKYPTPIWRNPHHRPSRQHIRRQRTETRAPGCARKVGSWQSAV